MPPSDKLESLQHQGGSKVSAVEKKMLLRKISQMNNLPTPSANMMKVMLLLRDEDVKVSDLVIAIEKDQSMVAQILKLVNSGFYGLRKTVESVEHAIALLGIINIKQVVYSASIMEFFSDDEQLEWNHSYSSSVLMGNLIKENELPGINILPMAMLMHDLGKVVLRRFSPKKYQVALQHAASDKIPIFRVEDAMLQINHAEVGAVLLERWDSAEEIVKPVLQHHFDVVPQDFIFETALVQFVNWVDCTARGIPCFEPCHEIMEAAGIEEIDKTYWIDAQVKLIDSLENVAKGRNVSTSGTITRNADSDTKSIEKREGPKVSSNQPKTRQIKVTGEIPQEEAAQGERHVALPDSEQEMKPENETAELLSLPTRKPESMSDTATISQHSGEGDEAPPLQSHVKTRIANPSLSGKEQDLLKSTYKEQISSSPSPSFPASEAESPAMETEDIPSAGERPTQVLKRKGPVVNIHQMPPSPQKEEAPQQPKEPLQEVSQIPGLKRPTQVISRRTGQPVAPTPLRVATSQPELVSQEKEKGGIPQREDPEIMLTTQAVIRPQSRQKYSSNKGILSRFLAWLKQQL